MKHIPIHDGYKKKKVQYITNMFSNYNRQKTEIEYKSDYL